MKVAKFVSVGTFNTLFCYLFYILLVKLGLHYNFSLALDYLLGILIGYLLNRHWTFVAHGKPRFGLFKYLLTYIGAFSLNVIVLSFLVEFEILGPVVGQIVAFGVVTILTFLLQNYWVFKPVFKETVR